MKVNIISLIDPTQYGGLEAYIRLLLTELPKRGVETAFNGGRVSDSSNIRDLWRVQTQRLLPLMTRRSLRHCASAVATVWGRRWAMQQAENYDICHFVGTGWNLIGFPAMKAARHSGKVFTCWPAVHPGTWGDAPLDIDLYKKSHRVFCQSTSEVNHLRELGVPEYKLLVIPCGPEVEDISEMEKNERRVRFRNRFTLNDQLMLLFIGRKSKSKGYHQLREAVNELVLNGLRIVLVAIGRDIDPPYPAMQKESLIDLGIADEMTKLEALSACDLFALPSEAESFGIVYTEAWAFKKPVICGSALASQELVLRHKGGLATDGTVKDIVDKVEILATNRSRRNELGENGYQAFRKHYSTEAVIDAHVAAWRM